MKIHRVFIAVLTICFVAGCATAPPPKKVNLSEACYGSMSALPVLTLSPQSSESAKKLKPKDYADQAKCLQTSKENKIPVALYRLEGVQTPSIVSVMLTSSSYGVLAAKVSLLDQNFNEISYTGFDKFINRGNTYSVDVFINSADVRYVAVAPDNQQVGKSEKQYSSQANAAIIPAGPVFFVYTSGKDSVQERAFSDVGSLLVTVKPAINAPVEMKK